MQTYYDRHAPFVEQHLDAADFKWLGDYRPPVSPFSVDKDAHTSRRYCNHVSEWIFVHDDIITNYKRAISECDAILNLIDRQLHDNDLHPEP